MAVERGADVTRSRSDPGISTALPVEFVRASELRRDATDQEVRAAVEAAEREWSL